MRKSLFAAVAAMAVIASTPAIAGPLVADTGWQDDVLDTSGQPTEQSPWTFTISATSILSVVDCCNTGDVYTLSGDVSGVTSFYAGNASDVQASGAYGGYWTSADYSKIALTLLAGTYTFSITGDGAGGLPAGLGVRLDTAAVPEPATWGLMIAGFGATAFALRRRQKVSVRYA